MMHSVAELFQELHAVHLEVQAAYGGEMRVYPGLRPDQFEGPGLYNVLDPAQTTGIDTGTDRDTPVIGCRVGIHHNDADEQWPALFAIADTFRAVVDPALRDLAKPIANARGRRVGMQQFGDSFNDVRVIGLEFPIRFQLEAFTA